MNGKPIRVLLVEDDAGDARLFHAMLTREAPDEFQLTRVGRLAEALGRLESHGYDLILSDLGLPDSQGLPTFLRLKAQAPTLPIVVLSGLEDQDFAVKAMQEGAQDYLVKGQVDGQLLARSLRYAFERKRIENERDRLIDERQRADEARQHEADRYRSLTEATAAIVWNTPASGEIEADLPGWSAFTGQTQERIRGWGWLDAVHPEDRAHTARAWSTAVASQSLYEVEHRLRRHDGEYRHMLARGVPILNKDGTVFEWVGVHADITEQKHAEEALRVARDVAETANRAKSEFLAHMSHEIRTPMNGILGMTELVMDTSLSAEQREYLTMVKQSADALLRIINDILDFSKIEAGKMPLDREDFCLRETVGKAAKILALRAHQKKIELALRVAPDVPDAILGDADRLRQIIINLAGNAIKFTEHGEVVIDVNVQSRTLNAVELHFSVADTGLGIPRDKQARLFQAFQQLDESNTRRHGGTGLGLVIAQRLVQMMAGRIWFESEAGRGTIFHFVIRLEIGQEILPPPRPLASDELTNLPVMIVDDNATNRRILHEMLLHWHMLPVSVADGTVALTALDDARRSGTSFRLMLVDARMPEMDGFALVEAIRQANGADGVVFIVLSSADQPGDRIRCKNLGINAYLVKPVQQEELREAILIALGKKAAAIESADADSQNHMLQPATRSLRILLAEDQPVNQRLAVRLLEKRGHWVVVANDGREALDFLARETVDLTLMDMQMPEMDGFETTHTIRQAEKTTGQHLPIIAMTAFAVKGDRERCLAAGCDDYLAKPINSLSLYEVVERLGGSFAESQDTTGAPRPLRMEPIGLDWDRTAALARVDGDEAFLRELAELFVESCPLLLAQLTNAIQERDPAAIAKVAHTIQGNAASLGATACHDQARLLEEKGKAHELDDAEFLLTELQRRLDSFVEVLKRFAQETESSRSPELALAGG
jgi:two-component system, sensor histidine kinase and response regulator